MLDVTGIVLVLATSAIAACGSDRSSDQAGVELRPFRSTHTAVPVESADTTCPAGANPGKTVLAGEGVPIGNYTGVVTFCTRAASLSSEAFASASFHLIATDGDQIWFVLDRSRGRDLTVDHPPGSADSSLTFEAGFRIVGGTGRFVSATGSVTMEAQGGFTDTAFQATLDGMVSAPGLAR